MTGIPSIKLPYATEDDYTVAKEREGCDDWNFFTYSVMTLNWNFGAKIVGIYNDMWSGVAVEDYDQTTRVYVECTRIEEGIAAIVNWFYDNRESREEI